MAGFLLASEELRRTPDNFSGSRARWQMPSPAEGHWGTGEEPDWVRNGALLLREIRRFRMEGGSCPPELLPLRTPLTLPGITSSAHVAFAHGLVRKPSLRSLSDFLNVLSALLFLLGFTDEPLTLNACFGETFAFSLAKVQLAEFF